ncbi:methionine adenosyltransferase [Candidatus Woesearchaeota archaeon]|nr:methionine adenosyltransferase [Candidatus Woesearchaeota archaeon]
MINIEKYKQYPGDIRIELVERKGLGHPDTIADMIAEEFSKELSRRYIEEYGRIMHHNVDKLELVGGAATPRFGGGEITKPVTVFFSGRATMLKGISIEEIAMNSARKVFSRVAPRLLDHLEFIIKTRPGSPDLVKNFNTGKKIPRSNDTSYGSGYWPLTTTERIALETERYLQEQHEKHGFYGTDIKVMANRSRDKLLLTIAIAMLAEKIKDKDEYFSLKEELKREVLEYAKSISNGLKVDAEINTADSKSKNIYYITVSGTSLESGDDGAVGRGNRANGLITPLRHMSLEAYAGKNPVSHVGKIYNLAAIELARKIYEETGSETEVLLLSQIGKPINKPFINILLRDRSVARNARIIAKKYFEEEFQGITERILNEEIIG